MIIYTDGVNAYAEKEAAKGSVTELHMSDAEMEKIHDICERRFHKQDLLDAVAESDIKVQGVGGFIAGGLSDNEIQELADKALPDFEADLGGPYNDAYWDAAKEALKNKADKLFFGWTLTDDDSCQYVRRVADGTWEAVQLNAVPEENVYYVSYLKDIDPETWDEEYCEELASAGYANLDQVKAIYPDCWVQILVELHFESLAENQMNMSYVSFEMNRQDGEKFIKDLITYGLYTAKRNNNGKYVTR